MIETMKNTFEQLTKEKQEKIVDKVRKLLALAGSPNEHEAALAASKAKEIINEYNITLTELEVKTITEKKFKMRSGVPAKWRIHLANAVANGFDTKIYVLMGKPSYVVFVGTKVDAEVSHYVFEYLMGATEKLIKKYVAEEKEGRKTEGMKALEALGAELPTIRIKSATSYAYGIVLALEIKIKEFASREEKKEMPVAGEKDLMLLKNVELQKFWEEKFGAHKDNFHTGQYLDQDSFQKGLDDGKEIPLHQAIQ